MTEKYSTNLARLSSLIIFILLPVCALLFTTARDFLHSRFPPLAISSTRDLTNPRLAAQ